MGISTILDKFLYVFQSYFINYGIRSGMSTIVNNLYKELYPNDTLVIADRNVAYVSGLRVHNIDYRDSKHHQLVSLTKSLPYKNIIVNDGSLLDAKSFISVCIVYSLADESSYFYFIG